VNLAQSRSAVPDMFDSQTKKNRQTNNTVTDSAKNRTLRSLLREVTTRSSAVAEGPCYVFSTAAQLNEKSHFKRPALDE